MENLNILLIRPPQSCNTGAKYSNFKLPTGFLYMAGVLEKEGFKVKILDCPLHYKQKRKIDKETIRIGLYPSQIIDIIKEFKPNIVGVTCSYSVYEDDAFEVINLVKNYSKDILTVVGGAHASSNPGFVLRNKNIDLVIIGEGEKTMLEIAKRHFDKKTLDNIEGTALKQQNNVIINPRRKFIPDLDELNSAWHLIPLKLYFKHPDNSLATMRKPSADIVTSRGCPGNCVFCSIHTIWGRQWRLRTAKNVVDEMELLVKEHGVKQFRIWDDNLTLERKRIIEICEEITKRKLDIRWDAPNGIALWTLDREVLLKMKRAGFYRVTFGIESGSKDTLKYIGKNMDLDHAQEMIDYCHKIGLWVCSTFVIGFPFETKKDIEDTWKFIKKSRVNFPFVYIAQPYPGTRMFDDFKKLGLASTLREGSNVNETRYDGQNFTAAELNKYRKRIYRSFYLEKLRTYLNPVNAYKEFFSKINSFEDMGYVIKMFQTVIFKTKL